MNIVSTLRATAQSLTGAFGRGPNDSRAPNPVASQRMQPLTGAALQQLPQSQFFAAPVLPGSIAELGAGGHTVTWATSIASDRLGRGDWALVVVTDPTHCTTAWTAIPVTRERLQRTSEALRDLVKSSGAQQLGGAFQRAANGSQLVCYMPEMDAVRGQKLVAWLYGEATPPLLADAFELAAGVKALAGGRRGFRLAASSPLAVLESACEAVIVAAVNDDSRPEILQRAAKFKIEPAIEAVARYLVAHAPARRQVADT